MKHLLLFFALAISATVSSQSSAFINYQGALRDDAGKPLTDQTIKVRFRLLNAGTEVFSQEHSSVTLKNGIFNAIIGGSGQLDTLRFGATAYDLEVSVDVASAGYKTFATQRMGSVPFALRSGDVESQYSSGVLRIGSRSYTLSTPETYQSGAGIAINSGTISNTAPDLTVTIVNGNSNVNVTGTYPNFTVSSNPSLQYAGDQLSISEGNTVTIAPSLSITGNTLTIGPASNSITLPSAGSPTIHGNGIASVTPLTGGEFTVAVPAPTYSNNGPVTITGTYPNLTVNSPAVPVTTSVNAAGIATVSAGPDFTVGVQAPTFTSTGSTSITGTYPNFTVVSPASAVATTVSAAGIATVSAGPDFTVGVQSPTFTSTGPTSITGTYPNLTVVSPTIPATTSLSAAGIATVSAGPGFTVGVQSPTFTSTGPTSITGTYPNLTVVSPTVPATTSLSAAGIATVSAGPGFTVGVQSPTFTSTGPTSITGTYPNLTVVSPTVPATTSLSAAGIATVSAGPGFTVGVQSPTFTSTGPTSITGTYPNLTIVSPTIAPATSVSAAGIATVSAGPDFTVGVQTPVFTGSGVTQMFGTYPSYTVFTPVPPTPTVTSAGLAVVTPSTGMNFTVSVPTLTYAPGSGVLSSGTNTVLVAPLVNYTNNVLSVGPNSNSVMLTESPWTQTVSGVYLNNPAKVGIGTSAPGHELHIEGPGSVQEALIANSTGVAGLSFGTPTNNFLGNIRYDNSNNSMNFWTNNTPDRLVIDNSGRVGIGVASPTTMLQVGSYSTTSDNYISIKTSSGNLYRAGIHMNHFNDVDGFTIESNETVNRLDIIRHSNTSHTLMSFSRTDDLIGIGTTAPTASLHLAGTFRLEDGSQGSGRVLTSDPFGNATWQVPSSSGWALGGNAGTSGNFLGTSDGQPLSIRTNSVERIHVTAGGQVGIGNSLNPVVPLLIQGQSPGLGVLKLYNSNASGGDLTFLGFNVANDGNDNNDIARIGSERSIGGGEGHLYFTTGGLGTQAERMRIDEFGNVGIGTSNPANKLHVVSNSAVSGDAAGQIFLSSSANTGVSHGFQGRISGQSAGNYWAGYFDASKTPASTGNVTAVKGNASSGNPGNGNVIGIDGVASSGVLNVGVSGSATGGNVNYGVYGIASGTGSNWAGWFEGNTHFNGKLVMQQQSAPPVAGVSEGTIYYDQATQKFRVSQNGGAYTDLLGASGWGLNGNAGTSPATDFIGTSDAQSFAFRTNNAERMRFTSSGALGIGTAAPTNAVHITSASTATATLRVDNTGGGGFSAHFTNGVGIGPGTGSPGGNLAIAGRAGIGAAYYNAPPPTNGLIVQGNTGIGTSSPGGRLDVIADHGSFAITNFAPGSGLTANTVLLATMIGTPGAGPQMRFEMDGSPTFMDIGQNANQDFVIEGNDFPRLVVQNSGNVGIGTTSPSASLHVAGTLRLVDGTQANGRVLTSDANGNASWAVPMSGSRVRSIILDPNMIDVSSAVTIIPPSKTVVGGWQRPCVNLPDGSMTQVQLNLPVPSDWNTSSNFTVTLLYSSPSTAGNFVVSIDHSNVGLGSSAESPTSGGAFALPPHASVTNGLQQFNYVIPTSAADKMVQIVIRRDGANGSDTSNQPMYLYGVRFDYMD